MSTLFIKQNVVWHRLRSKLRSRKTEISVNLILLRIRKFVKFLQILGAWKLDLSEKESISFMLLCAFLILTSPLYLFNQLFLFYKYVITSCLDFVKSKLSRFSFQSYRWNDVEIITQVQSTLSITTVPLMFLWW